MSDNERSDIETTPETPRKRVVTGRSPMYPFFDLERSLTRAKQLYDRERLHATPVMTALKHWGYSNASGKAGMTLSALKQFGLMEDLGRGDSRRVQLTTRTYDILNTPHEAEREQLLRDAALSPEVHQELWNEYGTALPSVSSLAWTLTKERGFTAAGAEDLIRQWKRTMEFARLDNGALANQPSEDHVDEPVSLGDMTAAQLRADPTYEKTLQRGRQTVDDLMTRPPRTHDAASRVDTSSSTISVQTYTLPMGPGKAPVEIRGVFPLTTAEWRVMMASLKLWKSMLVEDSVASPEPDDDEDVLD